MTKQKTEKLSEIKAPSPVFRSRLATEDFVVGDVVFQLRALPATLETYLYASRDSGKILIDLVRFGLIGVTGLCDELGQAVSLTFEEISLMSQPFQGASWDFLNGLDKGLLTDIGSRVQVLTKRSPNEVQAQDFTQPASPTSPAAKAEAAAVAVDG